MSEGLQHRAVVLRPKTCARHARLRVAGWLLAALAALPLLPAWAADASSNPASELKGGKADDGVPVDEIRRFVSVYNAVKQAYVEPVDDRALMHSAVRGLLLELDPHSVYLDKDDAQAFDEATDGAYVGIGVELDITPDGGLQVVAPLDDSPAQRAGLRTGDRIVAINGKALPAGDGGDALRGPEGSEVKITVRRAGTPKPIELVVTRAKVQVSSVRERMLAPGYGYLRISAFQADTANEFERAVAALRKQSPVPLAGVVLDMRENPGGLLVAAVQIADDLLDRGEIVSTRGRVAASDSSFKATPGQLLEGVPVVVLVDAGTASAAEVLTAALQDNARVRVVGSRTFGKGSVQSVLPLDNGDAVKLTTARYYTPAGQSIQARGIVPDVVLAGSEHGAQTEADLPSHLHGDGARAAAAPAGDVLEGDAPITAALAELKRLAASAATPPAKAQATPPATSRP
jgi:carboxyl-terminal processing protease